MTNTKRMLWYVIGALCVGVALSLTALNSSTNLTEEGLFEVAQVVVIATGLVLWLVRGPADTSVNIFVVTVGLLILGRETSWAEAYGGSETLVKALKYSHAALLIGTLIALTVFWMRRSSRDARLFRGAFRSKYMAWLALGCLFFLLGDVFEKRFFGSTSDLFWEEWFELVGIASFLIPPLFRAQFR